MSSSNGTYLPALFSSNLKDVNFCCFVTNKEQCNARKRAQEAGVKDYFISAKDKTREQFEEELTALLRQHNVDLILLVGFMRIFSPLFTKNFPNAILNIHPSLLPAFEGGMDKDVHAAILNRGCKVSGATLHFINEHVDSGPIMLQEAVKISPNETSETLKVKVQEVEQKMLIEAIEIFRDKRFRVDGNIVKLI